MLISFGVLVPLFFAALNFFDLIWINELGWAGLMYIGSEQGYKTDLGARRKSICEIKNWIKQAFFNDHVKTAKERKDDRLFKNSKKLKKNKMKK